MDDNLKKLVDEMLDMTQQLTEYKMREKALINLLWDAELKEAKECEYYKGKYRENIDLVNVHTKKIRDIIGVMPCPEAIRIFKQVKEQYGDDADDED